MELEKISRQLGKTDRLHMQATYVDSNIFEDPVMINLVFLSMRKNNGLFSDNDTT